MENGFVGAGAAFVVGVGVAWLNSLIMRAVFRRNPSQLLSLSAVRQLINVLYLVALYFLAGHLPWALTPLLIGGALGVTLPSMYFAYKLARENDARQAENKRKEAERDG